MIKEGLLHILNNYNKKMKFGNNDLGNFIRNDFPKSIKNVIKNKEIEVIGSCGQGNWADVPWIAFLDFDITKSTRAGYFVVYLFKSNMDGVYISLNQGWQSFQDEYKAKIGKIKIKEMAEFYRESINRNIGSEIIHGLGFSYDDIELADKNKKDGLPRGYELGHIAGKYYPKKELESSTFQDDKIIEDLNELLNLYLRCKTDKLLNTQVLDDLVSDIEFINSDKNLSDTEKKQLINARRGQGKFRNELLEMYKTCPVTNVSFGALLKASHIKPWKDGSNEERLDKYNGIMLAAHIDALFDKGYLSFEDSGEMLMNDSVKKDLELLGIKNDIKIRFPEESKKYLKWHRNYVFQKNRV